jgi:glycosyltransferase involved in cell wall biosynthesis
MHVWLPSDFRSRHGEWSEQYFSGDAKNAVQYLSYESAFGARPKSRKEARNAGQLPEIDVIHNCVQEDNSSVCYIGYLDRQLQNIALGRFASLEAKIVGVLDQPYLHYWEMPDGMRPEWLTHFRFLKGLAVNILAAHRSVTGRILMGDPLAPKFYRRAVLSTKYQFLPEPFSALPASPRPLASLNITAGRLGLLFIGGTERRKGILELLTALEAILSERKGFSERVSFTLAGRILDETRENVLTDIARLRSTFPRLEISVHDHFLTAQEYVDFIAASDLVCIPYLNMVGTSGALAHAVHGGRAVLASDFGITGELVRRYNLGVVCDTSNGESLKLGMLRAIDMLQNQSNVMPARRADFLRDCTTSLEELGETIVGHLLEVAGVLGATKKE